MCSSDYIIISVDGVEVALCTQDDLNGYASADDFVHDLEFSVDDKVVTIETISYKKKENLDLYNGNVVRWCGSLYIYLEGRGDRVAHLVSLEYQNHSAFPSDTWPEDPRCRISSIEYVASSVFAWIEKGMKRCLGM